MYWNVALVLEGSGLPKRKINYSEPEKFFSTLGNYPRARLVVQSYNVTRDVTR